MLGGTFENNDIKNKILTYEKRVSESDFWKNNLSAKDRLGFYDSKNKETIFKFY